MYRYPYGNTQQLNLDWILAKIKELEAGGSGGAADLEAVANALVTLSFNLNTQYRRYDYCFLNGKLYRCLSDTSGVFDPSAWQEALIGDDLAVLTRWINAIDAAAVVDVKFDTTGTNGKIQQKYHDEYHDVVEVDYTPVQNSKRPLSSNAGYELNGAITNGTLLNGMPQTAMRIPANSDLNSYTTAGTYYVQSDGDAATIANMPRASSGTLYVINRAIGSYKTQFYFPSTSIQIYYTRNYNNGTWTDWIVKSDSNSNIANVELTNTATQTYSKGDFVVVNGVLQKVIASISNGDSFSSGTNITPAVAMNVIKSMGAHKTFTAKLYDYNTYIRDIPNQWYWKIGELIIVLIETTWNHTDDIQTMVEIRDLPCNVVSGVCYIANLSGTTYGADRTIQGSGQWAYIRPNLKSSEMNNTDGVFQLLIFGYERNGYPYPD